MNKRDTAGLIYDYVVQGLTQADIADRYGTDQWGGVSGTLQFYGFYDGTKGGYRRRFARGLYGLNVTQNMIYDFVNQYRDGDDYYFEDFVRDNLNYYAKKQGKLTKAEEEKKRKAAEAEAARKRRDQERAEAERRRQQEAWQRQEAERQRQQREWERREAERRRQAEAAAEAERQRRWEEEQRRRAAEEAERQRIAAEQMRRKLERERHQAVIQMFDAGNYQNVYNYCNTYRRQNMMEPFDLWFKLGYACHELKKYDEAVYAYKMYIAREGSWKNKCIAKFNSALALEELNRTQEALTVMSQLKMEGYGTDGVLNAIRRLNGKVAQENDFARAAAAHQAQDYAGVVRTLKRYAQGGVELKDLYFKYAYACAQTGDDAEALKAYGNYINYNDSDSAGYNNRANLYEKAGQLDQALADLQKAYQLGQRDLNIEGRMERIRNKKEAIRRAEQERIEAARRAEQERIEAARRAEEERRAEELRRMEAARRAEQERLEAERRAEEARIAEEKRRAEEERLRLEEEEFFLLMM